MPSDVRAIYLGNHERHIRIEAERMAVIHHDGARLHGFRQKLTGDRVVRRTKHEVATLERFRASLLDRNLATLELNRLARAASARKETQFAHGNTLLIQALEHLRSHGARRA